MVLLNSPKTSVFNQNELNRGSVLVAVTRQKTMEISPQKQRDEGAMSQLEENRSGLVD